MVDVKLLPERHNSPARPTTEIVDDWQSFLVQRKEKFQENMLIETEPTKSLKDFKLIQTLGSGTYGTVILAKLFKSEKYVAIKVMRKYNLVKRNQVPQALNEKRLLQALDFTFIIKLEFFFKDNSNIYFVLPFINGGELFNHLRKKEKFEEPLAKFYATQVVMALEYLHFLDVMYRDLKPENVLIDSQGYVKITDLGFSKIVTSRTYTLCGTPDYLAPEVILCKGYSHSVDWWAFGVFIYELVVGYPPFYSMDPMHTYKLISTGTYKMLPSFSQELKDLLFKLLQVDPSARLGTTGAGDVKHQSWFRQINWLDIVNRTVKPPFVPTVSGPGDASNFDAEDEILITIGSRELFKEEFKDF